MHMHYNKSLDQILMKVNYFEYLENVNTKIIRFRFNELSSSLNIHRMKFK